MNNQTLSAKYPETKLLAVLVTILVLVLLLLFFGPGVERGSISVPSEVVRKTFPPIDVKAKAVYVYDARTQTVLFAKDENTRHSLASLAKIVSVLVAEELSPLYGVVSVNEEALLTEGDNGLFRDEKWSVKDLLEFSLIASSNDGIKAVALSLGALSRNGISSEEIIEDFVMEMNKKAGELGLKNTYFLNETGLDFEFKGGAYGTAKDMNTLLEYVLTHRPELFTLTRESTSTIESLDNYSHVAKNTNVIVSEIPGVLISKTGYTNTAGGNLVFVFDPELGRPIIVSILGSTDKERFEDARVIIKAVMDYINT